MPLDKMKISSSDENEASNIAVSAVFLIARIRGAVYCIMNIVHLGTRFRERHIDTYNRFDAPVNKPGTILIYKKKVHVQCTADPEFTRPELRSFIESHNIII